MDKQISVYGIRSFIASRLLSLYSNETVGIDHRKTTEPITNNIVNMVSSTHNYHIKEGRPREDITVNLVYLMNFLEAAYEKYGGDFTFTQISSWFVYGKHYENLIFHENHACNPTGPYSITKRASEQLLINYCETIGAKWRILRLANIFGVGDKPTAQKNALQWLINEIVENRPISIYNNGDVLRDFLWVNDAARAIYDLVTNAPANEIYNVGSGVSYTMGELIDEAKILTGYTGEATNIEPPDFHSNVQTLHFKMNIDKYLKYTSKPTLSIKQFIPQYVEYLKNGKATQVSASEH